MSKKFQAMAEYLLVFGAIVLAIFIGVKAVSTGRVSQQDLVLRAGSSIDQAVQGRFSNSSGGIGVSLLTDPVGGKPRVVNPDITNPVLPPPIITIDDPDPPIVKPPVIVDPQRPVDPPIIIVLPTQVKTCFYRYVSGHSCSAYKGSNIGCTPQPNKSTCDIRLQGSRASSSGSRCYPGTSPYQNVCPANTYCCFRPTTGCTYGPASDEYSETSVACSDSSANVCKFGGVVQSSMTLCQ
jgi:hypothetical protein